MTLDQRIILQPSNQAPISTYNMLLCGRLSNYATIERCMGFQVKVTACLTTIVAPANGIIGDVSRQWYDPEVPVSITDALLAYRQEPNCEYPMSFEVKYEKFPVQYPGDLYDLPAEAVYSSSFETVYLQKCQKQNSNPDKVDMECLGAPYAKQLTFVVVAKLADPQDSVNVDVKFNFNIGDSCMADTLWYTQSIASFDYVIASPAVPVIASQMYESTYPPCPKKCVLIDAAGNQIDGAPFGLTFRGMEAEVTPGALISLQTSDYSLNGLSMTMGISCASMNSDMPNEQRIVSNQFTINFVSECYTTVIAPAFKQNYEIDLYGDDTRAFDALATVNPNCGPLIYELNLLIDETNAQVPADFFLVLDAEGRPLISVNPAVYANKGIHTLFVNACIEVGEANTPTYSKICEPSSKFTVIIKDPCLQTDVIP